MCLIPELKKPWLSNKIACSPRSLNQFGYFDFVYPLLFSNVYKRKDTNSFAVFLWILLKKKSLKNCLVQYERTTTQ